MIYSIEESADLTQMNHAISIVQIAVQHILAKNHLYGFLGEWRMRYDI